MDYEKIEKLLQALASETRLQILELIQKGVSNPGDVARKLNRHRSTIEKHLRVLLASRIVEKVPSLNKSGQLTIQYKICEAAVEFLSAVQEASENF